jgi:FkbM family methyltransferase
MYMLKKLDGKDFIMPIEDTHSEYYYFQISTELECLQAPYEYLKGTKVVVQAGGNVGYFPHYYAKKFERVYTFEPDSRTFKCLVHNVPEDNVIKIQAGLGKKTGEWITMKQHIEHSGQTSVDTTKHGGVVPVLALDDLNLDACDLIQYDLEGYEYNALLGSIETIKKYSPVISIEDFGHGKNYGIGPNDLTDLLVHRLGYTLVKRVYGDNIYVKN